MTVSGLPQGAIPLRERRTFGEEWADYAVRVLPGNAGPVQRSETRMAFYAGAMAISNLLMENADGEPQATELDVQYLASVLRELLAFNDDLQAGRV